MKMKCEYKGTKIGIEGEIGETDCESCDNEAVDVLRLVTIPQSRCQAHLIYGYKCMCKGHSEYLHDDAQFKWEKLPTTIEEEIEKRGKK